MAFKLIWSPSARLDLKEIALFIDQDNPSAAKRFVKGLVQAVKRLADFPMAGRVVPEIGKPHIREIMRRPCRIVYRITHEKQEIEIMRIWHSARGIPRMVE
jgi:toxin ParE1/3/4